MTIRPVCLILLAVLAVPQGVAAQSMREGDPIIVTGTRKTPDEARAAAKAFVRSVAAIPVSGQYARWDKPVCVKVSGVSEANAGVVADRIETLALDLGLKVAGAKCKPNMLIVFTGDGAGLVQTIAKKSVRTFGQTPLADRELLKQGTMAVRWWFSTDLQGIDGHATGALSGALLNAQVEGAGGMNSGDGVRYTDSYNSSLIGTRVRAKIENATVIVDVNKAKGRTLKALSSYVGMVALARIKMGGEATDPNSILSLFADSERPPAELSENDRAFLTALYRVPPNRDARVQEAAIVAEMVKAMTGG